METSYKSAHEHYSVATMPVCRAGCFVHESHVTVLLKNRVQVNWWLSTLQLKFFSPSSWCSMTQIKLLRVDISHVNSIWGKDFKNWAET